MVDDARLREIRAFVLEEVFENDPSGSSLWQNDELIRVFVEVFEILEDMSRDKWAMDWQAEQMDISDLNANLHFRKGYERGINSSIKAIEDLPCKCKDSDYCDGQTDACSALELLKESRP
jgi:hypothetical protein